MHGVDSIKDHLQTLSVNFDKYSSSYDHFNVLRDFKVETNNNDLKGFCSNHNSKSIYPSPKSFQSYYIIEKGQGLFYTLEA